MAKNEILRKKPSLRTLSRKILSLASSEEKIPYMAKLQALQFVDIDVDGQPIEEQLEAVEDVIESTLY